MAVFLERILMFHALNGKKHDQDVHILKMLKWVQSPVKHVVT